MLYIYRYWVSTRKLNYPFYVIPYVIPKFMFITSCKLINI